MANGLGGKKGGGQFKVGDFMPKFGGDTEARQSQLKDWREQRNYLAALTLASGGEVSGAAKEDLEREQQAEHQRLADWMAEQRKQYQAEQDRKAKGK